MKASSPHTSLPSPQQQQHISPQQLSKQHQVLQPSRQHQHQSPWQQQQGKCQNQTMSHQSQTMNHPPQSVRSQGRDAGERNYEFLSHVGQGAYGQVYKARDPNKEGSVVAIKQIRIRRQGRHYEAGMPMAAVREISLLRQLESKEHPNIVKLLDVHHQAVSDKDICLSLVFEFIDQDLNSYLERCPPPGLGPDRIRDLMVQMVNGIDFLHSNRIVHRDLKPQNILITSDGILKLADFGLARIYSSDMKLTSVVVTLWYRAPEVLLTGKYSTAVDMWSCGCIFAELYLRRPLFKGTSEGDQLKKIFDVIGRPDLAEWPEDGVLTWTSFRPTLPPPLDSIIPEIDGLAKDLLEKLLIFNPERRIHAKFALHHSYFRDDFDRTSSSLSENDSDDRSDTPVSK
ncbi:cyclin-dependent kinase 4-like [Physella acuta]|uniref:cyclin-dependent kinase 4-like n=1 Tax=Physella acuta TaxID=109671 RepID=UPI0027DBF43D|nr:cyclin-dependent kinase 4-like [Physella acuta]XP_059154733.1 cyclin-dependent kinase 4-like [Physella acuta]XP_059154734.1 cyclin-dependent kinase 4-like [Physella acuta]